MHKTKQKTNKIAKLAMAFVLAVTITAASLPQLSKPVLADQYDDRIAALQQNIAAYQAETDRLNAQASTLQNAVAQLASQKAALQAQIDINQVKYDQLVAKIADTQAQITITQDSLGKIIANIYVDDKVSPIEMLASSNNISDFIDKQEARSSIRADLSAKLKQIKDLKAQLDAQQKELSNVLAQQKAQRDELAAQEAQQANLLAQTRGQESNYQSMIASSQAQIEQAKATQALIRSRYGSRVTLVDAGSLSAYPWNSSNCPMWGYLSTGGADGNGGDGYGYGCRQCASYVAWRIAKETGIYYRWGDAYQFTSNAREAGYKEGSARAGSAAVMDPGTAGNGHGHVAWVEAVSDDGSSVLISQYNYNYGAGFGMYSKMWLSVGAFDHYLHILN